MDELRRVFPGDGEMARRMRVFDWSTTPLGPAERWPQSLRSAVSFVLSSKAQIVLYWGPELTTLYNDAYAPVYGAKHPAALGRPVAETWSELWATVLRDLFQGVLDSGEAYWASNRPFYLARFGFTEETFFDVSYDPVRDEQGEATGVLCIVTETTRRVISERRMRTLCEVAAETAEPTSAKEACEIAARLLAKSALDVPFAAIYLVDGDATQARLTACAGVEPDWPAVPSVISLAPAGGAGSFWPFREVLQSGQAVIVDDVERRLGSLACGVWPEPLSTAVVLPVRKAGQDRLAGFLVVGVSPRLLLDEQYLGFFDLLANQLAIAIAGARAYEEERLRAEALEKLDRAKTAFFSNVSHEFRTPLTLILGQLEDALQGAGLPPQERETLEVAHRNGLRLLRLVNTLLEFSRIEAGRAEATFEQADVGAYTKELASVFRSATDRAGLSLSIECGPILAPVFIDREMWEKIVLNLLSNAFKFTLQGGITVRVSEREGWVDLVVRDTGSGIPAAELPRLFERFHRVKGVEGRTHEGTGIGLALVSELVRLHGGEVGAASEVGRGSTFTVSIPTGVAHIDPARLGAKRRLASTALGVAPYLEEALRWLPGSAAAPAAFVPSQPVMGASTAGARIVLADDNADMREYVARLLREHWDVEAVTDGVAALDAIRRRRPDLVLGDVMMPRLDGMELLRAIRSDAELRSLPVVLLSARAGEESRVEGLAAGADDYLVKPFSARELVARIHAHLEMASVRKDALAEREEVLGIAERAREEAEAANQAKDDFLAVLSHELRSPMNAMLGWLQILRSAGTRDPSLVTRAVATLERNIWIQAQVINDLLDVSRIMSGKLELERTRVDLASVVTGCVESLRPSAEAKQLSLRLKVPSDALELVGDVARLQQIVSNVLGNAIKFTDGGGVVTVTVERTGRVARVLVEDTGEGIAPEFVPHLFERFRQADSAAGRRHGGLGLGLAIVKSLVMLHGGEVQVASGGIGHGARFAITLPLADGLPVPLRALASIPEATRSLPPLDVIVVEDDADSREALHIALEEHGVTVRSAYCVREALEFYEARSPDVVISDIGMPGEDGYRLIRTIREREERAGRRTLAIAMTGFAGRQDRATALRAGYDEHVAKPVALSDLLTRLRALEATRRS